MKNKIKNLKNIFPFKIFLIIFLAIVLLISNPLFISGCKLNSELKKDSSNTAKEFGEIFRYLQNITLFIKASGSGIRKIIIIKPNIKYAGSRILISAADSGSIEVTKTNLVGTDRAKLSLYYMNGSNKSYVSPSPQTVVNNGVAVWAGLIIGKTYYVEESFDGVTNQYSYDVINPAATIEVDSAETFEKTIKNVPKYGLIEVTKNGLKGNDQAKLSLYYLNNSRQKVYLNNSVKIVSAKNPVAIWANLGFNKYYVEESFDGISNAYSYNVTNPVATIDVDSAAKFEETVINDPVYGSIEITKTNLLAGDRTKLSLYYMDGSNKSYVSPSPQVVANNNKAVWKGLIIGKTYFVEESFDGINNTYSYKVINPVAAINVENAAKLKETVQNDPMYASIEVTKTGLKLSDQANLSLYNTRGTGDKSDDVIVSTSPQLMANNEKAVWSNLPYGTYYVIEDFNGIKTNVYTYKAKDPLTITLDTSKKTETFINEPEVGSIEISKTGLEFSDQANLSLYSTRGTGDKSDDVIVSASPQLVENNQKAAWSNLPYGTYYVIEDFTGIKTNVYTYNAKDPLVITLDAVKKTETFTNEPEVGSIEIIKTNLLAGDKVNLSLYYLQGSTRVNILPSPQTAANNGKAIWTGLPLGKTYYVEESFEGTGNVYSYNVMDPVVAIDVNSTAKFEKTVQSNPEYASITITKKDIEDDSILAGAVFGIFNQEGAIPAIGASGESVQFQTSGSTGKVRFDKLAFGTYVIKEILPPSGYRLSEPVVVQVGQKNEPDLYADIHDLRIPGFLKIIKVDSITNLPVAGAQYDILDGGSIVGTLKTDSDGIAYASGLSWFKEYIIKEGKVPEGYLPDSGTYPVSFSPAKIYLELSVDTTPAGGVPVTKIPGINEVYRLIGFKRISSDILLPGAAIIIFVFSLPILYVRKKYYRYWKHAFGNSYK